MHLIKNSATIAAIIIINGCASPKYNYRPTESNFSFPATDEILTINLGEPMLSQGTKTTHEGLCIDTELKLSLSTKLLPGYFPKIGNNDKSSFYTTDLTDAQGGRVQSPVLADQSQTLQVYWNGETSNKICNITQLGGQVCKKTQAGNVCNKEKASNSRFQQTLIFNGINGNQIKIGYREYSSDLARPAFNNDIEYDLEQSPIIGYKSAKLEIIDASNTTITYRVIENFKLP